MKFKLDSFHRDVPLDDLIHDLKRVYEILSNQGRKLTYRSYSEHGKYSSSTFAARFGSWNGALSKAKLSVNREKDVDPDALFENLQTVWLALGRQPVYRDMSRFPSKFTARIYIARFGGWRKALHNFVNYVESDQWLENESAKLPMSPKMENPERKIKRRTSRNISERLRFRILLRDGFSCQTCGASPLREREVELHVDHKIPWSKGGETDDANLQTKCTRCNLGKGNAFEV